MSPTSAGGGISPTSLRSEASPLGKRQEEVLPMAKLEQRRYKTRSLWRAIIFDFHHMVTKNLKCFLQGRSGLRRQIF